jgi:hypothetical protein
MRLAFALLLLLAACADPRPEGMRPVAAGESRADGVVTMAAAGTIWNPVDPDWRHAEAAAADRCRDWGYEGAQPYAGWQETCRAWDRYGRCVMNRVTRFYSCGG